MCGWRVTHLVTTLHANTPSSPHSQHTHTNTKSHSVSCHSRSGKTAIGEGQSVAGAKNKVIMIFIKYMRDLRRKWFCRQSIRRNYNNSALEDGLFHFIMSPALSCRLVAGRGHREQRQGLCETDTWCLNAFIYSLYALHGLNPWTIIFLWMPVITFTTDF